MMMGKQEGIIFQIHFMFSLTQQTDNALRYSTNGWENFNPGYQQAQTGVAFPGMLSTPNVGRRPGFHGYPYKADTGFGADKDCYQVGSLATHSNSDG